MFKPTAMIGARSIRGQELFSGLFGRLSPNLRAPERMINRLRRREQKYISDKSRDAFVAPPQVRHLGLFVGKNGLRRYRGWHMHVGQW
jgi:hypothetical protein